MPSRTFIRTGRKEFDDLVPLISSFLDKDLLEMTIDGKIIREYMRRRDEAEAFAEWFSIDPPFPDGIFGDAKLVAGAYVNGGIMPLVGGELAKAAFEHGLEEYGANILERYFAMLSSSGETFLWYFPDGTPASIEASTSPDAEPTDGWGSSAMLWALVSGQELRLCETFPSLAGSACS